MTSILSVQFLVLVGILIFLPQKSEEWNRKKLDGITLYFHAEKEDVVQDISNFSIKGKSKIQEFFGKQFKDSIAIYIHSNRAELDKIWQSDWNYPEFKSECWMVASGIAKKVDILSPNQWEKEACEHSYSDKNATFLLVTHELIHSYHGQVNKSPDFSDVEGIDWFVEGLAVYASGQLTPDRKSPIKQFIENNKSPKKLDDFWKGKYKYGLSGSMVQFIDQTYGRQNIIELLPMNNIKDILSHLKISESELIENWENSFKNE